MSKNQYTASIRETVYLAGMQFIRQDRVEGDTIVEALQAIMKKSQTIANRWSSPFAKAKYGDEYRVQFDYRGLPGHLKLDQHNPAVLTLRGSWGGEAQSDQHVAPSIVTDVTFQGPIGHCLSDMDAYHLLTYLYVNHFNVYYDRLPSDRIFYREQNTSKKNDAQGLSFPPSFVIPSQQKAV